MTFKEKTTMALGQALKGTSRAPEGPSSHPAVGDTHGCPTVRSAKPLELSGDRRGFPAPSKSELDEKRGASHIGVRILNGACQMRQTRPHSHHQREASRDEPREDAAPLLPQTQETLSRN